MTITHEMSREQSAQLCNILGQLPINSGAYPLWAMLASQHQTQVAEAEKPKPGEPSAE